MAYVQAASSSINGGTWRTLAWVGVALQAIALVAVLFLQRWGGAFTVAIFLALSVAFLLAQDRLPSLISLLVVIGAMINGAGWAWNLFDQFAWYDEVVHTFTSFAVVSGVGYLAWTQGWLDAKLGSRKFLGMVALYGFGLGVLWEIVEFIFISITFWDTVVDLVLGTIGAAIAGWFAGRVIRRQSAQQVA